MYLSGGKKYSFFGRFDVFCFLETTVLRFALLPYYRRYFRKTQFLSQNKNAMTQKPRPLFPQINSRIFFAVNIPKYWSLEIKGNDLDNIFETSQSLKSRINSWWKFGLLHKFPQITETHFIDVWKDVELSCHGNSWGFVPYTHSLDINHPNTKVITPYSWSYGLSKSLPLFVSFPVLSS